jgi:hypothetical protein
LTPSLAGSWKTCERRPSGGAGADELRAPGSTSVLSAADRRRLPADRRFSRSFFAPSLLGSVAARWDGPPITEAHSNTVQRALRHARELLGDATPYAVAPPPPPFVLSGHAASLTPY